jgi:hypothetical protein
MHLRELHELAAAARGLRTEADVNRWLDAKRIFDPESRICLKVELMAAGELSTDQTPGHRLATDHPNNHYRPVVALANRCK